MGLKSTTCAYHRNDPEYSLDEAQLYTNSFLIIFKKKKKKKKTLVTTHMRYIIHLSIFIYLFIFLNTITRILNVNVMTLVIFKATIKYQGMFPLNKNTKLYLLQ